MVQHVARVLHHGHAAVGHMGKALVVFVQAVALFPPLAQAVVAGLHRQHRGGDAGIQGQRLVHAKQLGAGHLVGRVAQDFPPALGIGPRPVLRQPIRLVLREAGVGLHQAAGHTAGIVVGVQGFFALVQLLDLIDPLGIARGRLRRPCGRHAKAFQVDQAANALGPHTSVHHGHVATHAVAHQVHGLSGGVMVEQHVQIRQVVGKHIVVGLRRAGLPKAAPVGRQNAPLLAQRIHRELVRGAHVHPAMQQHQRGQGALLGSPMVHVVVEAAQGQGAAAQRVDGLVHGAENSVQCCVARVIWGGANVTAHRRKAGQGGCHL